MQDHLRGLDSEIKDIVRDFTPEELRLLARELERRGKIMLAFSSPAAASLLPQPPAAQLRPPQPSPWMVN